MDFIGIWKTFVEISSVYEIDIVTNIYEILAEKIRVLPEDVLEVLLEDHLGLLIEMCRAWMKEELASDSVRVKRRDQSGAER